MLNTYVLEGGLGKHVAFTALLPKLVEKAGQPVQVWSPYVDVFAGNPNVAMAYDMGSIPIDDPRILASDNIIYVEPYKNNFAKGDQHLIESYCELLGVEYDVSMKPELFTDSAKPEAIKWLKANNIKGDFILVQFTGGQSTVGFDANNPYVGGSNQLRNYPPYFAQGVVNTILEKHPNLTIIDCTLPNEPGLMGTVKCAEYWPVIVELAKKAKGFLGIDSAVQHFCAATATPGVVIWGNTRWTQFGWMHHQNLSFLMSKPNDYIKIDIADPRNIMVDPGVVYQVLEEHVMNQTEEDVFVVECAHD